MCSFRAHLCRTARLTAEALAVQAIKDSKLAENIKRLEKEQTRAKELLQSVAVSLSLKLPIMSI